MQNKYLIFLVKKQKLDLLKKCYTKSGAIVTDSRYNNLLHLAVKSGNLDVVKFIYMKSPLLLFCNNIDKEFPIDLSIDLKNKDIYFFLKNKKELNLNSTPMFDFDLDNPNKGFNLSNKFIIKKIQEKNNLQIDIGLLNLIYLIKCSHPYIDENLLRPLVESSIDLRGFYFGRKDQEVLVKIFKKISIKRLIKICIIQNNLKYVLLYSLINIPRTSHNYLDEIDLHNIKNFSEVQPKINSFVSRKKQRNFILKGYISSRIINKSSCKTFKFISPRVNYDLIKFGEKFRNCIGNGSYSELIDMNNSRVFFIFVKNKPYACVELDRCSWQIKSIKGVFNSLVINEYEIQEILFKIRSKNKFIIFFDQFL
jgi:hypothetical protein